MNCSKLSAQTGNEYRKGLRKPASIAFENARLAIIPFSFNWQEYANQDSSSMHLMSDETMQSLESNIRKSFPAILKKELELADAAFWTMPDSVQLGRHNLIEENTLIEVILPTPGFRLKTKNKPPDILLFVQKLHARLDQDSLGNRKVNWEGIYIFWDNKRGKRDKHGVFGGQSSVSMKNKLDPVLEPSLASHLLNKIRETAHKSDFQYDLKVGLSILPRLHTKHSSNRSDPLISQQFQEQSPRSQAISDYYVNGVAINPFLE